MKSFDASRKRDELKENIKEAKTGVRLSMRYGLDL